MGKNGLGSLLGAALFAGAAYGAYKYLKEYTNFKKESEEDFRDLEENADGIRTAAKRTYVAIKERSSGEEIKAAAGDLLQKTGDAARNVGNIAAAAGKTTAASEIPIGITRRQPKSRATTCVPIRSTVSSAARSAISGSASPGVAV